MRKFLILCFQFLLIRSLQYVDTAFGNSIGINEICVGSAWTIIETVFYCVRSLGTYGYRCLRSNIKSCIVTNIALAFICCIILLVLNKEIAGMFDVTSDQTELLCSCLKILALQQIPYSISDILAEYMILNERNKLWIFTEISYMSFMIFFDFLVIKQGGGLAVLYTVSILCSIWYSICAVIGTYKELLKKIRKIFL